MIKTIRQLEIVTSPFNTVERRKRQFEAGERDVRTAQAFGQSNELGTLSAVLDQFYRKAWPGPGLLPVKRVLLVMHAAFEPKPEQVCVVVPEAQTGPVEVALEEAYVATQNLEESWVNGPKVFNLSDSVRVKGGCRSTSVGDGIFVAELVRTELMPDPELYRVAGVGFEIVTDTTKLGKPY